MKRIDSGNSSFEKIRQSGNIYIDKTKYLYNLLTDGRTYYFLSRPRRFGKSLTLSTLDAIFKGKRELFKGLYIDSTDYDWKEYPVIHIDFSKCARSTSEEIKKWINNQIMGIATLYNIELKEEDGFDSNLDILINKCSSKGKVVILIDEYDSLLNNNINNENIEGIREVLRGFYSVIKADSTSIRFCFITGVTKFSKMSIFSSMNNLVDISMDDEYSTMLGYTQKELEENFSEYIEKAIKDNKKNREEYLAQIKRWYDGYKFSANGESVYNPVSVGLFFSNGGIEFSNYWISTGGMTYLLTEIAKRVKFDISIDTNLEISGNTLQSTDIIQMTKTDVNKDSFMSLLYQSGYLTIKKVEDNRERKFYTLGYPNEEVEEGLTGMFLPLYLGQSVTTDGVSRILFLFDKGKVDEALESFKRIYSSIPYNEIVFNKENAWHASFISMMRLMGADIVGEVTTNIGRIDAVLTCPNYIYIIEFKFNQSAEKAIEQIREKKYYESYLDTNKKIHLLGINFSTEEKNIVEWNDEVL